MVSEKNIYTHPVTGENYIRGGQKVIFENGILCSVAELESTFSMSRKEIHSLMQEWSEDSQHYKYDYRYALSTGVLRHFQKQPKQPETKLSEIKSEAVSIPGSVKKTVTVATIILFVMTMVGALSACMSAYHTTIAFKIFGRPLVIGFITGTVMVLFSATAFTAARWFWVEKGIARMFSFMFAALGILVIAYSMLSTLVVNYKAWNETDMEEKTEIAADSEELTAFDASVKLKTDELEELKTTESTLNTEAEYWKDKSWKRYDSLQNQLSNVRTDISKVRSELSSLIASRPQVASKVQEDREDVFTFLASFIKINPRTIRLFMQAVPAMFFDLISPFALSCAVYLAEKRNKEEAYNEQN